MKKNIAIIFGGNNSEHDVSLSSAGAVASVIDVKKYDVIYVAILKNGHWILGDDAKKYLEDKDDTKLLKRNDITKFVDLVSKGKIELVLPILHGEYGEDGRLQGFLDILDVPYVFSGHSAHALGMDKAKTKKVVAGSGVQIIPGCTLDKSDKYSCTDIVKEFGTSLFVKPAKAGSSVGISKVESEDELEGAIEKAFEHGDEVIVEKTVLGRELTVGIIDSVVDGHVRPQTLPIVEIIPKTESWYDYEAKYTDGGSEHVCPAEISDEVKEKAEKYAEIAFDTIGCKDLARADFLLDENNELYFLEINTIPGMTVTSLIPDAAQEAGISFEKLINNLIENNL